MRLTLVTAAALFAAAFAAVVKAPSAVGPLSPEKDPRTSLEESIRRMRLSIDRELVYLARVDEVKRSMNTDGMVARQVLPADEETESTFHGFTDKVNDGSGLFRPIRPGVSVPSARQFDEAAEPSDAPSDPTVTDEPGNDDNQGGVGTGGNGGDGEDNDPIESESPTTSGGSGTGRPNRPNRPGTGRPNRPNRPGTGRPNRPQRPRPNTGNRDPPTTGSPGAPVSTPDVVETEVPGPDSTDPTLPPVGLPTEDPVLSEESPTPTPVFTDGATPVGPGSEQSPEPDLPAPDGIAPVVPGSEQSPEPDLPAPDGIAPVGPGIGQSPEPGFPVPDGTAPVGTGQSPEPDLPAPGFIGEGPSPEPLLDTTPIPTLEEDDDDVCFPAHATVQLEDGSIKKMSEVQLGDRVLVGSGKFSEVFMFTHKMSSVRHSFIELATATGHRLVLTKGHYLYVNDRLAAASTVREGDMLTLGNNVVTTVDSVRSVISTGLYNPQTIHGDLIVNGVRASTYTLSVEPKTAHALLAPLRAVYDSIGFSLSAFDMGADYLASLVPSGSLVN